MTVHVCFEDTKTGERWDFGDASFYPSREDAERELREQGFIETERVRAIYTEQG